MLNLPFFVVFVGFLTLAGCGESGQAAGDPPADPGPVVETPATAAGDPPPAEQASGGPDQSDPTDDSAFESKLAEATALQADGETRSAQILVRMMQRDFTSHPRAGELVVLERQLNEQRDLETSMSVPLRNLGSDDPDAVRVARRMLRRGGEAVWPLLRRVARGEDTDAATEATILLAEMGNPAAAPLLIERYQSAAPGPQADRILSALRNVAASADGDVMQDIDQRFAAEPSVAFAEVLIAAFAGAAEGDEPRFAELTGSDASLARLRGFVEEQMQADDAASVAWAGQFAATLGLAQRGLRADYFEGTNFDKRVATRLVEEPLIVPDKYPLKRSEQVSVKWTGQITVPTAGKYTFYSKSDDGQRVIINGKKVIDDWNYHGPEERTGSIELAAGQHAFEAQWMQGSSGYEYSLQWSGPGIDKKRVPAAAFTVTPWSGME